MSDKIMQQNSELEATITQALERRPEVVVPEDFAARVRASLPPRQAVKKRVDVRRTVGVVMAVAAAVGAFVLAPHAAVTFANLAFDLEVVFVVEMTGIVAWLAMRQGMNDRG